MIFQFFLHIDCLEQDICLFFHVQSPCNQSCVESGEKLRPISCGILLVLLVQFTIALLEFLEQFTIALLEFLEQFTIALFRIRFEIFNMKLTGFHQFVFGKIVHHCNDISFVEVVFQSEYFHIKKNLPDSSEFNSTSALSQSEFVLQIHPQQ